MSWRNDAVKGQGAGREWAKRRSKLQHEGLNSRTVTVSEPGVLFVTATRMSAARRTKYAQSANKKYSHEILIPVFLCVNSV